MRISPTSLRGVIAALVLAAQPGCTAKSDPFNVTSAGSTTDATTVDASTEPDLTTSGLPTDGSTGSTGTSTEPTTGGSPVCGDGILEGDEACDDGNDDDDDACVACAPATCGDGHVRAEVEACDDGNQIDDDGCTNACVVRGCGDGVVQGQEECDDGNAMKNDGCSEVCRLELCGDGIRQWGEGCDEGPANSDAGACTLACEAATCGDGLVHVGVEACDDGDGDDSDECPASCQPATCGDGYLHADVEACDDANTVDGDACSATCAIEATMSASLSDQALEVPDDAYDGTLASMACLTLVFPPIVDPIVGVTVEAAITHPWISDLTIKVVHPDGSTVLTLVSRPGTREPFDDGASIGFESSNVAATSPLVFKDGAAQPAEAMGHGIGDTSTVCVDDEIIPCVWRPSPESGPGVALADFVGKDPSGAWRVCVGDGGVDDGGIFDGATIVVSFG